MMDQTRKSLPLLLDSSTTTDQAVFYGRYATQ